MTQEILRGAKTGAEAAVEALKSHGVKLIFGLPGSPILPFHEALAQSDIKYVLTREEKGAIFMAEGYARTTGRTGVALVTSGPGATNTITGLNNAYLDGVPVLVIAGNSAKPWEDRPFQGAPVSEMVKKITKLSIDVNDPDEIAISIHMALLAAESGRSGPTFVSVTKASLVEKTAVLPIIEPETEDKELTIRHFQQTVEAIALLKEARRPLIIAGHGGLLSGAGPEIKAVAEAAMIPVVHTLLGKNLFPDGHKLNLGMMGEYGRLGANRAINSADVILAVGTRFAERSIIVDPLNFAPHARIIRIDKDDESSNVNIKPDITIKGDAKVVLAEISRGLERREETDWLSQSWLQQCQHFGLEDRYITEEALSANTDLLKAAEIFHTLSDQIYYTMLDYPTTLVVDAGNSQVLASRYFKARKDDCMITTGGAGTMGFALPAAIGVKIGSPEKRVIAVAGDGAFQMTSYELATLAELDFPLGIIIPDNYGLALVNRQNPNVNFRFRKNPDFIKQAEAVDIKGEVVERREELTEAIKHMLYYIDTRRKPYVLHIKTTPDERIPRNNGITYIH